MITVILQVRVFNNNEKGPGSPTLEAQNPSDQVNDELLEAMPEVTSRLRLRICYFSASASASVSTFATVLQARVRLTRSILWELFFG